MTSRMSSEASSDELQEMLRGLSDSQLDVLEDALERNASRFAPNARIDLNALQRVLQRCAQPKDEIARREIELSLEGLAGEALHARLETERARVEALMTEGMTAAAAWDRVRRDAAGIAP